MKLRKDNISPLEIRVSKIRPVTRLGLIPFFLSRYRLPLTGKAIDAMMSVKGHRPLYTHMFNIVRIVVGKVTPNWVRLIVVMMRKASLVYKMQGAPGYVKYLKSCSVLVQQIVASHKIHDLAAIGPRVSRSKSGLPRIIPCSFRKRIIQGDYILIRLVLSIFALFRVVIYTTPPKLSTITNPRSTSFSLETDLYSFIPRALRALVGRSYPSLREVPIFNIFSASPSSRRKFDEFSTHPRAVLRSMIELVRDPTIFPALKRLCDKVGSYDIQSIFKDIFRALIHLEGFGLSSVKSKYYPNIGNTDLGKIGLKQEAAGKVRVFAMVDAITQWILKALHQWIFSILKRIPMDGTFDQLRPLKSFTGGPLYSFDLSAATDRLPLTFQIEILRHLFGSAFAQDWATVLVDRSYTVKYWDKSISEDHIQVSKLRYAVGQPMGALSSWGMLALTHHVIVQIAAIRAGCFPFNGYALLGDDIVIWNSPVAKSYLQIMKGLGLEVNLSKSILSPKGGGLEFAKRTIIYREGTSYDVSPTPLKEYSAALETSASFVMLCRKYKLSNSVIKSLLGLGYKSSSSKRWKLLQIALQSPMTALEFKELILDFLESRSSDRSEVQFRSTNLALIDMAKVTLKRVVEESKKIEKLQSWFSLGAIFDYIPYGNILKMKGIVELSHFREKFSTPIPPLKENLSFFEKQYYSTIYSIDAKIRTAIASAHYKKYDGIISDLKVMIGELEALHDFSIIFDPEVDEDYTEGLLQSNISTMIYWCDIFFNHEEELSRMQGEQLVSPAPLNEETSPRSRELSRLSLLWKRWANALQFNEDNNLSQSSILPIHSVFNFFKTLSRASKTPRNMFLRRTIFSRINPIRIIPYLLGTNSWLLKITALFGILSIDGIVMMLLWVGIGLSAIFIHSLFQFFWSDMTPTEVTSLAGTLILNWIVFTGEYFGFDTSLVPSYDDSFESVGVWKNLAFYFKIFIGYFLISFFNHAAEIMHAAYPLFTDPSLNVGFLPALIGVMTGSVYVILWLPIKITSDALMTLDWSALFFGGVAGEIISWPGSFIGFCSTFLSTAAPQILLGLVLCMKETIISILFLPVDLGLILLNQVNPFPFLGWPASTWAFRHPIDSAVGLITFAFLYWVIRILFGF